MIDLQTLSMTEIIRLQNQLQEELTRRFERRLVLLFSDIVGSTGYFAQFGDAAGRQLQQLHIDLLGPCLQAAGGRIVDTAGDGAFCALGTVDDAVGAVVEFQRAIARANAGRGREHQLLTRIGLHFGPVLTDGQTVSGDAVNLCARVTSVAEPGEVRLTRQVFQEMRVAQRLVCRPLGTVELRGISHQVELLALDWRDRHTFPRHVLNVQTGEVLTLPQQDIVRFGRLAEHEQQRANDIVLAHPDAQTTRQISRWHFELRRLSDGLTLRTLSENSTEVDGKPVDRSAEVTVCAGSEIVVSGVLTLRLLASTSADGAGTRDDRTTIVAPTARGSAAARDGVA